MKGSETGVMGREKKTLYILYHLVPIKSFV